MEGVLKIIYTWEHSFVFQVQGLLFASLSRSKQLWYPLSPPLWQLGQTSSPYYQ